MSIARVVLEAIRGVENEEILSNEEYRTQFLMLLKGLEGDFSENLAKLIESKRENAIASGQLATTVIDPKLTELELLRIQEDNILAAGKLIVRQKMAGDFELLFQSLRNVLDIFPKARMAKITRLLIEMVSTMPESASLQIDLCLKCIKWCEDEKRTFLRHRIQTKLASLYQKTGHYTAGLDTIQPLLKEVKRLDDKQLLVEVHLVEAKLNFSIRHIPRAKAALTAAKTNANAIHCPPLLQAEIDLVGGSLHAEEQDFRTAYSYFYEAFEAFHTQNDPRAVQALKYMMLCRIMADQAGDITNTGRGTTGLKYLEHEDIKCLIEIAKAYADRSLENFEACVNRYREEIQSDLVLSRHIEQAAEQLLEQSLVKMASPYSQVEISHLAQKARLPEERIQFKLSQMILDEKISGTLDQRRGVFVLYENKKSKQIYEDAVETFGVLKEAEVVFPIDNVDSTIVKVLETLAQRFPPESVMTISPVGKNSTESSISDGDSVKVASLYSNAEVRLTPSSRRGMKGIPSYYTNWILSKDPMIYGSLLKLAIRGGDVPQWAEHKGLPIRAVEEIVTRLTQDEQFYDWVFKLQKSGSSPASFSRESALVSSGGHPREKASPNEDTIGFQNATGKSPVVLYENGEMLGGSCKIKNDHDLVELKTGRVVGRLDSEGRACLTIGVDPISVDDPRSCTNSSLPGMILIPRGGTREGYWLVDPQVSKLVGHIGGHDNIAILHPTWKPILRIKKHEGIQAVRWKAGLTEGGYWLTDSSHKLIGHISSEGRIFPHPVVLKSFEIIPNKREDPEMGSWIYDTSKKLIGHISSGGMRIMHPSKEELASVQTSGFKNVRNLGGHSWLVNAESGDLVGHYDETGKPVIHPIGAELKQSAGILTMDTKFAWLLEQTGRITGHTTSMHPQRKFASARASGIRGVRTILRDADHSETGGPWLASNRGEDNDEQQPVLNPMPHFKDPLCYQGSPMKFSGSNSRIMDATVNDFRSDLAALPEATTQRVQQETNLEATCRPQLTEAEFGGMTTEQNGRKAQNMLRFLEPKLIDSSKGCWIIDDNGRITGHTDEFGGYTMHPKHRLTACLNSQPTGLADIRVVPRDGTGNPDDGGPWLVDSKMNVIGHFNNSSGDPVLHPANALPISSATTLSDGTLLIPDQSGYIWAANKSDGAILGHRNPCQQRMVYHPTKSKDKLTPTPLPGVFLDNYWVTDSSGRILGHIQPDTFEIRMHPLGAADSCGATTRYVEVPIVTREVLKEVPTRQIQEIKRHVTVPCEHIREKICEVPEIQYIEKYVDKIVVQEIIKKVPKKMVIDVPKEVTRTVTRIEPQIVEKIVEVPQIIEVPKLCRVEKIIPLTRYINKEQSTVVAQRLKPVIREGGKAKTIKAKSYEPKLFAIDIYIPKPVNSTLTSLGKVHEVHDVVEVPAPQFNTLLKTMNENLPGDALQDLYVRGHDGIIPMLPVTELSEIIHPVADAFKSPNSNFKPHKSSAHRR